MKFNILLVCLALSGSCMAATQSDFERKYYELIGQFMQTISDRDQVVLIEARNEKERIARSEKFKALDCKGWKENMAFNDFVLNRFDEYEKSSVELRMMGYTKESFIDENKWLQEQIDHPDYGCK